MESKTSPHLHTLGLHEIEHSGKFCDWTWKWFLREKEPIIYEGDLMDEEGVLDFLTSLEAMDLPDRIEEVNSKILSKIIEDTDYVAVLFCEYFSIKNVINLRPQKTKKKSLFKQNLKIHKIKV